jgi:DNA mismatch repair protein MutH
MFLVFHEVIHPVTREPLLTVGQKITGSALTALSKEFGFDMPEHLAKQGIIQYIGP